MANKKDVEFDELDLDDIDFGGDFDFDAGDEIKFDADGDRSPIESFKESVKDTVKNRIFDRGLLRRLVSFALPKGYSQGLNAYDSFENGIASIYKDNIADMQPYMRKTSTMLKQTNSLFRRLLPKRLQDALEESEHDAHDWGGEQESQLDRNISGLDDLLKMQAHSRMEDSITGAAKDIRERKEFDTSIGVSLEMGKGIGRLVQYQDNILINYHRKSLELKYRHIDVSVRTHHAAEVFYNDALELLKAVGKNTALPDFVKLRNSEAIKEQLRHRLATNIIGSASNFAAKHLGNIRDNVSQSLSGALGAVRMGSQMTPGMSKAGMAGSMAGGFVAESAMDMLEYLVKEAVSRLNLGQEAGKIKEGDRWLREKLSGTSQRLNDYARSDTTREGALGQMEQWFKRLFDSYTITDKIHGKGVLGQDEAAKFDNIFHQSVTEVIPGFLASMEKHLRSMATGEDAEEHAYSPYTGGFVNRETLNKQHLDIGLKAGAGDAVRQQLDQTLAKMKAGDLSPEAKRALRSMLLADMSSNRDFNPQRYVKPDTWTNAKPEIAEELVEYFADKYGINIDGQYDDADTAAKELRTDVRSNYLDLSQRITDYTGMIAGLSEVIGRRSWREMGFSEYDGRSGDNINVLKVFDKIANEGGDEFAPKEEKEEEKADPFKFTRDGLRDGLNARAELQRKRAEAMEAEQKRIKEEDIKRARSSRIDVDVGGAKAKTSSPPSPAPHPGPVPPTPPVVGGVFGLDPVSIDRLTSSLTGALSQIKLDAPELKLPEVFPGLDDGTHKRLDSLSELTTAGQKAQADQLDAMIAAIKDNDPCKCEGRGPRGPRDEDADDGLDDQDAGMSRWGRAKRAAWDFAKKAPGRVVGGLGSYLGWSFGKIGTGLKYGAMGAAGAVALPFMGIKGLGITDVYVVGQPEPALLAKNIRKGLYFDVNTRKIIAKIKDITGPVKSVETGDIVLSQDEFDKGLRTGTGESLAGWGLRRAVNLGVGAVGLAGRYTFNAYGLMGRAVKGIFNLVTDQFLQFDAYFPGDQEPRIRSSLLKKGYYRNEEGQPIKSLKDINGPIFDINGNEVISKADLEKYKSLYSRNGSVLYTVGRGAWTATKWVGDLAKRGAIGYGRMTKRFYEGLWKGVKAVGRGIGSAGNWALGKMGLKSKAGADATAATAGLPQADEELQTAMFEVGLEQLKVQRSILDLMREKFDSEKRDKWDLDGDGDRDNSWEDILSRRKKAADEKKRSKDDHGGSAATVAAIDKLGKKLDASIEELGDRVEEAGEDGMLDQASDLAEISEGIGGSNDRRGRRGRRGGRGGRRAGPPGGNGMWAKASRLGGRIWNSGAVQWGVGLATAGYAAVAGSGAMATVGAGLTSAGAAIGSAATATGAAVATVLGSPVVLVGAALAAAAYKGYKWYNAGVVSSRPIFCLRMTQYGVSPYIESRVKQMLALEELVSAGVTFNGVVPSLDPSKINITQLMKILEIEQTDTDRLRKSLSWLSGRFRPVYLAHVQATNTAIKTKDLSVCDDRIDGSLIKEFMETVVLKKFDVYYNNLKISPFDSTFGFGGDLDCNANDVQYAILAVRHRIKETEAKKDNSPKSPEVTQPLPTPASPTAPAGVPVTPMAAAGVAAATAVVMANKPMDALTPTHKRKDEDTLEIGGSVRSGLDPQPVSKPIAAAASMPTLDTPPIKPGNTAPTVEEKVEAAPSATGDLKTMPVLLGATPSFIDAFDLGNNLRKYYVTTAQKWRMELQRLDIPMAVRFLQYGITEFKQDKCNQLKRVEDLYWESLRFNGYDYAMIDGNLPKLERTVLNIFEASGPQSENVLLWLRYRFMPTFLQYAISVRRRLPGDVRQAPERLSGQLMREVLEETLQAVDVDSGSLVWLNAVSPWPNARLGTDAGVARPYLESLPRDESELRVKDFKKKSEARAPESPLEDSGLFQSSPNRESEEGGLFSRATSKIKQFFDAGSSTPAGGNTSTGQFGMSAADSAGGGGTRLAGPPVSSMGSAVNHPGGGTGGDINSLPNNSGDGWATMGPIILGAAKMAGFDPFIAANVAAAESRFRPRAGAGTSSAKGLYQFINGTWAEMLRRYGKKYGIAANTHQFDPRANALMGMEYMKENYAYLKKKAQGVKITDTALYMAHFLGAYGAKKFLTAPASANVQDVVGAKVVNSNASVFREPTGRRGVYGRIRTVGEALAEIDKRLHAGRDQHNVKPGENPTVEAGSENPAQENRAQTDQGEPNGAPPDVGGEAPTSQGGDDGGTPSGGSTPQSAGSEPPVTNAANGASPTPSGQTYSTPPSPDAAAAQASGNAVLTREPDDAQGTFGKLRLPDGTEYFTLELPWRDNATGVSCIPPGTYKVAIRNSPKFGRIYEVMSVPNRSAILIHSGNVAGDKSQGFNSHVEGCILLGMSKGSVNGQKAVQQSKAAIAQFNEKMGGRPFTMTVVGAGANTNAKTAGDTPQEEAATNASPQATATDAGQAATTATGSSAGANTNAVSPYAAQAANDSTAPASTSQPTTSQAVAQQNQTTTAQATAELSVTIAPLLQKQLEVANSMDSSLKSIRQFLEIMSKQQPAQQTEGGGGQNQSGGSSPQQEGSVAPEQPYGSSQTTQTGSGRSPLNIRRNNAVN